MDTDLERIEDIKKLLVPIPGKLEKRFYKVVLFLIALIKACSHTRPTKTADLSSAGRGSTPGDDFRCFLNKLAQLIDSKLGGSTVTAIVALDSLGRIQYRFASNDGTKKS